MHASTRLCKIGLRRGSIRFDGEMFTLGDGFDSFVNMGPDGINVFHRSSMSAYTVVLVILGLSSIFRSSNSRPLFVD